MSLYRRYSRAFLVFMLTVSFTVLTSLFAYQNRKDQEEHRFVELSRQMRETIFFRMQTYLNALVQARALVLLTQPLQKAKFGDYIESINFRERYPGADGMGILRVVPDDQLGHFTRSTRKDHLPQFTAWPRSHRPVHHIVQYIEPLPSQNREVLGYDMGTDPTRRIAFEKARDTGQATATDVVQLPAPGFLVFLPIYRGGKIPATLSERRASIWGYVYSAFRAEELFPALFPPGNNKFTSIRMKINDGGPSGAFVYDSLKTPVGEKDFHPQYTYFDEIPLASHVWRLSFHSLPAFERQNPPIIPLSIAASGLVLSLLLFFMIKGAIDHSVKTSENEAQLRLITDAVPALIAYVNPQRKFLFANRSYAEWYDKKQSEIVGKSVHDIVPHAAWAKIEANAQLALAGQQVTFEDDRMHAGEKRHIQATLIPDLGRDGRVRGFFTVVHDVSEIRRREEELKRARDAADAASRAKSDFLANISHEIRTPLGAVLGFAELALSPEQSQAERETAVAIVRRNTEILSRLIDDLLDLSKVEANRLEVQIEKTDLRQLITDVETILKFQAKEKMLDFEFRVMGEIPETIQTDSIRLRQILMNIIGNSVKFTAAGGVYVDILWRSPHIEFHVRDTGPGMKEGGVGRLFKPFSQADSSKTRKFGGTGLGLALSRRLARALGGDVILVKTLLGQGTEFQVTVTTGPLEHVKWVHDLSAKTPAKPAPVAVLDPRHALDGTKVLVVEDSPDIQVLVSHFLKSAGAQVETAANGLIGRNKAMHDGYDVILMDIQMPELDGYAATQQLRAMGYKKPVIALTAHAMKGEREKSLRAGCDEHLTKPVNRGTLIDTIVRVRARMAG